MAGVRELTAAFLVLGIVCVAGMVLATAPAQAACAGPEKGNRAEFNRARFKEADAAITGKVIRRRSFDVESGEGAFMREYLVVFRIRRVFKGRHRLRNKRVRVWSSGGEALYPKVGFKGGVFLDRHRERWTSSVCGLVRRQALRRAAHG